MRRAIQILFRVAVTTFGIVALCFGIYAMITEPGVWRRLWADLIERPSAAMSFRFILQPVMATIAAWKDGAKDAATGRSPYFWTVLTDPTRRRDRLAEGIHATSKVLAMGLAMDLAYQAFVLHHFYPVEAIIVAFLLAFLPYLLLRGPFARVMRARK